MLLTRPEADSNTLKAEIEALGYDVMVEPLLSIEPIDQPELRLGGVQLLVLTSAHAVSALTDQAKTYPICAVGEATAAAARAAGCRNVQVAQGNVQNLSRLIVENCRSQDGSILHLSGEVIREGLAETLDQHGFDYRRHLAYRALAKKGFSDDVIDAWQRRLITAVLLFSPRTSEVLVHLLRLHRLESYVDSAVVICVSEEAATPCRDFAWRAIVPATRPNKQALLKALVGSITIC